MGLCQGLGEVVEWGGGGGGMRWLRERMQAGALQVMMRSLAFILNAEGNQGRVKCERKRILCEHCRFIR